MPKTISESRLSEPNAALIGNMKVAENLFLPIVMVIAALNIAGWLAPAVKGLFIGGWNAMSAEAALAAFLCALSLSWYRSPSGPGFHALSIGIATLVAMGSALVFAGHRVYPGPSGLSKSASWIAGGMTPQAAGCFALMGVIIVLNCARRLHLLADVCAFFLFFGVAVLVAGQFIGILHIFNPAPTFVITGGTALCLLLLTLVVFFHRAESGGVFSILLGRGIGSKVARILTPLVLVGPYLREAVRAHILRSEPMPRHYLAALLATGAVVGGVGILLYLAWRLNELEREIEGLSLRDALTGLYNLRGFRLLSEQALLLARRSGQPYSVLFIDVDNLKLINDAMGHQTGSEVLAATARILHEVFRETDVLGRIGGDEFAVAGQFNEAGIADALERLRQAAMLFNASATKSSLRFSAGRATSGPENREPLSNLLARADEEMYREKRRRKASAADSRLSLDPHSSQSLTQETAAERQIG